MDAFNEIKQKGLSPNVDTVSRIEVKDEKGEYMPVDHALRPAFWPRTRKRKYVCQPKSCVGEVRRICDQWRLTHHILGLLIIVFAY